MRMNVMEPNYNLNINENNKSEDAGDDDETIASG